MRTSPAPAELLAAIPGITARLGSILAALAALIARAFLRHPVHVAHIVPLWGYINRTARRFTRALDGFVAGTPGPRQPRPGRTGGPRAPAGFPTTRAWLVAVLRHEAAGYGSQLNHLLEEPATAALLAAAPQAARILRPLCHFLGISPMPLARPKPARPAPRAPAPAAAGTQPPATGAISACGTPPRGQADIAAFAPRPAAFLCPRLRLRWPWNALPIPGPA